MYDADEQMIKDIQFNTKRWKSDLEKEFEKIYQTFREKREHFIFIVPKQFKGRDKND